MLDILLCDAEPEKAQRSVRLTARPSTLPTYTLCPTPYAQGLALQKNAPFCGVALSLLREKKMQNSQLADLRCALEACADAKKQVVNHPQGRAMLAHGTPAHEIRWRRILTHKQASALLRSCAHRKQHTGSEPKGSTDARTMGLNAHRVNAAPKFEVPCHTVSTPLPHALPRPLCHLQPSCCTTS